MRSAEARSKRLSLPDCLLARLFAPASLAYRDNRVGSGGVSVLFESLAQNPSLTRVQLNENQIGDQGAEALAMVLPSMTTFCFDLWLIHNRLGNKGAAALADALSSCAALTGLFLGGNEIGDQGAAAFAQVLSTGNLLVLNLSGNAIGSKGAAVLAHALPSSPGLDTLVLCHNQIGDGGAAAFAQVLPLATGLTQLCLGNNFLSRAAKELLRTRAAERSATLVVDL